MKAFKTFIAIAIACAMILSMATSAFAAVTVNTDSVVSADAVESVAGERTVLVVNKAAWTGTALLDNAAIMYINQVADADLAQTLTAMAGKNLVHGDYTVLVGNENGTVDAQEFTAIKVVANNNQGEAVGGVAAVSWDVTMNSSLVSEIAAGNVKAKFYATELEEYVGDETVLSWGDANLTFTGSGDFTFTAETTVGVDYVGSTQLEISAGTVSNKN